MENTKKDCKKHRGQWNKWGRVGRKRKKGRQEGKKKGRKNIEINEEMYYVHRIEDSHCNILIFSKPIYRL